MTAVTGLTGATLERAPSVCQTCVWWQSRTGRTADKERWLERAEDEWGAWGALYRDDDGRLLGSIQYGPAGSFRGPTSPGRPPSDDAVLVTCVYVVSAATPWVEQSLFLAAIGDVRDKGAKALEAFAYRYPEGESTASASSSIAPSSRATSSPTSASARSVLRGGWSSSGSSSAGSCPSWRESEPR